MRTHETKQMQGPPALATPTTRVSVPWLAFAALGAFVYSTRFLFYQDDAYFLDAAAGMLCAIWCVLRQDWLGWGERLLIAANLIMVPLTVLYVAFGLPPLGVLQALYLLLTSKPPFVMLMGLCL